MTGRHRKERGRLAAALAVLLLAPAAGIAGDSNTVDRDGDHDVAYQALKDGRFVPLADILAGLKLPAGSEIVGVELEQEDRVPVYEIYYIDAGGHRREILVDARSGNRLEAGGD